MVVAEAVQLADRLLGVRLVVEADEGEALRQAGHLVLGQVGAREATERPEQLLQVGLSGALREVCDAHGGVVVCGGGGGQTQVRSGQVSVLTEPMWTD